MMNQKVAYEVRWQGAWAVVRRGPKGGQRFIAAYKDEYTAAGVAAKLNIARNGEL